MNRNPDYNKNHSNDKGRYDDMLELPHHVSSVHPQMPLANRAAQFSPFAALTGYEDEILETTRLTDEKAELSDTEKEQLDRKLRFLSSHLNEHPAVSITYFVPDVRKTGGSYRTDTSIIKKIDTFDQKVIFYAENEISDGRSIPIDAITDIQCGLLQDMDFI